MREPIQDGFSRPIKPGKFAEMVGVTVRTLQRWDRDGILVAYRTPTNRRYYTEEQYEQVRKPTHSRIKQR